MATHQIHPESIQHLNDAPPCRGEYVLYWMQQAQRAEDNPALEYAIQQANALHLPVLVVFGLLDSPHAYLRHYTFLLEGLQETQATLAARGIPLVVRQEHPIQVATQAGTRAALLVCDRGYLRHQRTWRQRVAAHAPCRVTQVETDVVVPVEAVSNKREYAARTLRPKLHKRLPEFLVALRQTPVRQPTSLPSGDGVDLRDLGAVLRALRIDHSVAPVSHLYPGGTSHAKARFRTFLRTKLPQYTNRRNQPQTEYVSHLSMYLHFGQISPVYLTLQAQRVAARHAPDVAAFLDELIVRRELARNFVHFTPDYDAFSCLPNWAKETLTVHRQDPRPYLYTRDQLEAAATHDPYWNAACREMLHTGYMHNHMRMYWGKKILEWSHTPEEAFDTTLAIMHKYFLDARDPNAYANVAWLFGLHDRPWAERPIFGKVRIMSASGLERKCDIGAYVRKVEALRSS